MSPKAHGTSEVPVQDNLRYGCDKATADRICNFNRHYAEHSGYAVGKTSWLQTISQTETTDYFDSNTGKLLFTAPVGRSYEDFIAESKSHGWPSFRDAEVNWEFVRCLENGECVSVDGTHLGHNLPDRTGNRYCINLGTCVRCPFGGCVTKRRVMPATTAQPHTPTKPYNHTNPLTHQRTTNVPPVSVAGNPV